ncbi:MAG: RNA polymerase sigma factor [Arenimonas sp.]|nr:RNA polymerase sigma factor [Arenimonas sp.]MBP7981688.1 RNA polymerase sigma factor [Arenimonas sp.]
MSDPRMAGFLASVEQKAYRMALFAVKHRDDALDIVQDAMLQLVQRYSDHAETDWPPLFHRILQNRIMDAHRSRRWSRMLMPWREDPDDGDAVTALADGSQLPQAERLQQDRAMARLQAALQDLPVRQQQAYLLRHWEGLDVKQTAQAMRCSEGSVKTHLSRALTHLKKALSEDWP